MLEIGSKEPRTVVDAARSLVGGGGGAISLLPAERAGTLDYRPTDRPLDEILTAFSNQELASVRISPTNSAFTWVLLFQPHFDNDDSSYWVMDAEYTGGDVESEFGKLLSGPQVLYATAGVEESVDVTDGSFAPGAFPWNDPSLILGAVYEQGRPVVRRGPAWS